MRKKKIVYHSDGCWSKTGFGKMTKNILSYLYQTGKYDIVEYAMGAYYDDPKAKLVPWTLKGVLPNDQSELDYVKNGDGSLNEPLRRMIEYGSHCIDKVIKEEKPDIYLGVQDVWAFNQYWKKKWWDHTNCLLHTTLDSLPLLPEAVEIAPQIKNYWVWADFAAQAMKELGHDHVKTVHGAIDTKYYYKMLDLSRNELRNQNNIPLDAFVMGFVFRNQPRKSVDKLLQAFKEFSTKNPNINGYLLLHTWWEEGWDIQAYIKEFKIPNEKVLTTYVCRHCRGYEIKPFTTRDTDCKHCGAKANLEYCNQPIHDKNRSGQITTSPIFGVTETQLNEIYNLMDVYVHPFNSGGQEIPIQEAKLTELITLVTNYSCGTEYCTEESGGLSLEWDESREQGSRFIKAVTRPASIVRQLENVLAMPLEDRSRMGKNGRQFVLNNCSVEVVGKAYEDLIDSVPFIEWEGFDFKEPLKNAQYPMPEIKDNLEWLKDIYKNILLMDNPYDEEGLKFWMKKFEAGANRAGIYNFFIQEANRQNALSENFDLEKVFDPDDKGKRILLTMPESLGDCFIVSSLFESIKELYPDHHLYVSTKPQYFPVFQGNPFVFKTIPYISVMENELVMTQNGGFVDILFTPHFVTQRHMNYLSKPKIALELRS